MPSVCAAKPDLLLSNSVGPDPHSNSRHLWRIQRVLARNDRSCECHSQNHLPPRRQPESGCPDEIARRFSPQSTAPSCRLEFTADHGCPALLMDRQSPFLQAASKAIGSRFWKSSGFHSRRWFDSSGGDLQAFAGNRYTSPGMGQYTDNLHSPDEHFLSRIFIGNSASAILWEELAKV